MLNRQQDEFQSISLEYICGGDAKNLNMSACEPGGSSFVMADLLRGVMRGAVDLDGKTRRCAIEVENVGADWVLPAKSESGYMPAAENLPKQSFRQGHLRAQLSRSFESQNWCAHLPPPPRFARHLLRCAGEDHLNHSGNRRRAVVAPITVPSGASAWMLNS